MEEEKALQPLSSSVRFHILKCGTLFTASSNNVRSRYCKSPKTKPELKTSLQMEICTNYIQHELASFSKTVVSVVFRNNIVLSPTRFIQMAPQYFFYNLPPSESKDILQNILNHGSSQYQEEKPPASHEEPQDHQTYDRCVIQ